MKCSQCGTDNTSDSRFCRSCAAPLVQADAPSEPKRSAGPTDTMATIVTELRSGTTFAGRFEVIEELGKGGMGRVYKVYDRKTREKIALKLLKPEIAADEQAIERFGNELRFARKISHRNVCRMYDLGEETGTHFITMEYVPGEDLKSIIRMMGPMSAGKTVLIARQIAEGLAEAHRLGVYHRDLKPQNIMLDREGNVRIMDFGIARSAKVKGMTGAGVVVGTPEYMAPEQFEAKEADARSDVYSLGVILYEMTTGRLPFEGETFVSIALKQKTEAPRAPKELNTQLPDDLSRLILRCLERDREKRFQSADEILADLAKIEKGVPTTERIVPSRKPLTSKEITVKFRLRNLVWPALAMIVLAAAAVVIWRVALKKEAAPIPGGKPSLAVLYFKNNTGDADFDIWRSALSDSIITDLSQSRLISVLSTDRLLSVLRKLELLDAPAYASEDVKRIAAEGRVNHILQGSLSKAGDLFRIDYTLQDVAGGKTVGSSRVEGRGESSMFAMVDDLTRKIKSDLKLSADEIAGDIDKSIGQITTSSPEAYKFYVEGARLHNLAEMRKAIEYYEKAVAIDPGFATAYRSMGIAYGNLGYSVKSHEFRKRAFDLSDRVSDRERFRNQAEFYGMSDRTLDKSIEAFKQLLALYPDDRGANNNLGMTYIELEDWDRAVERVQYLARIKDEAPFHHGLLADCYMAKGLPDEARRVIDQYLNDFPNNAYIRFCSAVQHFCRGEFELAQAEADRALSLAPDNFIYIELKGAIYGRQGNLAAAEKEYEKLLRLDEPVARILWLVNMNHLRAFQGRIAESQELLEKAIESVRQAEEKNWECYLLFRSALNHLLLAAPQKASALTDRMGALSSEWEMDFWQMTALHIRGIAALKMKDRDRALRAADELKRFIDRSMYKKEIRQHDHLSGLIELEKNNLPRAVEYMEKAVARLPGQFSFYGGLIEMHALYMDSLARAYFQAGDLGKARTEFDKILGLTTGALDFGDIYARSFYMLGKVSERQGDKAKAVEHYQKFLDLWKNADPGLPEPADAKKRLAALQEGQ